MVDVRRRSAAGRVMRFDGADHAIGVAAMDANEHRNAQDVDGFAAAGGNEERCHGRMNGCSVRVALRSFIYGVAATGSNSK